MTQSVNPYARDVCRRAVLSKTSKIFMLVLALHVGLFLLAQVWWQSHQSAPLRQVVTAALLPMFQDAPLPAPEPMTVQKPPPSVKSVKAMPSPQVALPTPTLQPVAQPALIAPPIAFTPAVTAAPAAPATAAPAHVAVRAPPSPVGASCEKPHYPAASERLREEGVVSLKFLISENGQVLSGSVEASSGFKRLDDAALAALSLCKFKPATVDGKPRQDWSMLKYRWQLND